MKKIIHITMTISAEVPDDFGQHELVDAVRFSLDLSNLTDIETDISAVKIISAVEGGITALQALDNALGSNRHAPRTSRQEESR